MFSNPPTDAMDRNDRMNILSLVPRNALFEELAKNLPAAAKYLGEKRAMDASRNDRHARAATLVDGWTRIARKNPAANCALIAPIRSPFQQGGDPTMIEKSSKVFQVWPGLQPRAPDRLTDREKSAILSPCRGGVGVGPVFAPSLPRTALPGRAKINIRHSLSPAPLPQWPSRVARRALSREGMA